MLSLIDKINDSDILTGDPNMPQKQRQKTPRHRTKTKNQNFIVEINHSIIKNPSINGISTKPAPPPNILFIIFIPCNSGYYFRHYRNPYGQNNQKHKNTYKPNN